MNNSSRIANSAPFVVFWLAIFAYIFFIGRIGLPAAHQFDDPVVMRDTGTLFPFLLSQENPVTQMVVQTMKHVEGPLQFLLLNFYCLAVGDIFPLNPATMQFPNTLLAFFTCVFAYLAGAKLVGRRFGYCCAISFVLTPWFAIVLRLPWYFNLLSCLLHFSTFYCVASLLLAPESPFYRVMAPLSLSLYFFTGLDWPSYLFFLVIFLTLTSGWRAVLRNGFNVLPILAGFVLMLWQILLLAKFGSAGLEGSLVGFCFAKFLGAASNVSGEKLLENALLAWGPQVLLALAGLLYYVKDQRRLLNSANLARGYLDAGCLWLLWAGCAVFVTAGSAQYLYVVGMPAAVLSGLALSRLRNSHVALVIVALVACQVGSFANWHLIPQVDEKRRILAAACFLVEQRPDLVGENKTLAAVDGMSWNEARTAAAVLQYARPGKKPLLIHTDLPWGTSRTEDNLGGLPALRTLTKSADAVVMETPAGKGNKLANEFWQTFSKDPHISWIAKFAEKGGEIYIGEVVKDAGIPMADAPSLDVKALSDRYLVKYDRISFLKNNVQNVRLFFTSRLTGY